ncbi:MAG: hypothetical protein EOO75_12775, partial [Myxococcales bacterium]
MAPAAPPHQPRRPGAAKRRRPLSTPRPLARSTASRRAPDPTRVSPPPGRRAAVVYAPMPSSTPLRRVRRLALGALAMFPLLACSGDDSPSAPTTPPVIDRDEEAKKLLAGPDWYRHAVFYEVYVRSFQDSNGDGIGDLPGLTSRLDYLQGLGVNALWLMPIMPTPFADSGYDVSDYNGINPDYGTLADFDNLLAEAHRRGMRVIMDLVLNHTSDQHAWFQESRSSRDNPKADWFVWSDTPSPPDNPCKTQNPTFGSSAWELDATRNQYYFHRFYSGQPDLNYREPAVVDATLDVARFWLDHGADGFRCDVIALLHESAQGCDMLPETRDYIRKLRGIVDQRPGAVLVAESTNFTDSSSYFGSGSDMFHMAFNFAYGYLWGLHFGGGKAAPFYDVFQSVIDRYPAGAQDALVIGSHDVVRASSASSNRPWRARRAAEIQLLMRGTPFLYYGEELGLLSGSASVVDARDKVRTPMPWTTGPGQGFTTGTPWIPFGPKSDDLSVATQDQELAVERQG